MSFELQVFCCTSCSFLKKRKGSLPSHSHTLFYAPAVLTVRCTDFDQVCSEACTAGLSQPPQRSPCSWPHDASARRACSSAQWLTLRPSLTGYKTKLRTPTSSPAAEMSGIPTWPTARWTSAEWRQLCILKQNRVSCKIHPSCIYLGQFISSVCNWF